MIHDIEDNYPEFLNDTMGYAWNAWDILSQQDITLHDRIRSGEEESNTLGDLGVWASCHHHLKAHNLSALIEDGSRLFPLQEKTSQALAYDEIAAIIANAMIEDERFDDASQFLEARKKDFPDAVEIRISGFVLKAGIGDVQLGEVIENEDEQEFLFDLSEAFLEAGFIDAARLSHQRCKALEVGKLSAIHVDLASMDRRLNAISTSFSGEKSVGKKDGEALKNNSSKSINGDTK